MSTVLKKLGCFEYLKGHPDKIELYSCCREAEEQFLNGKNWACCNMVRQALETIVAAMGFKIDFQKIKTLREAIDQLFVKIDKTVPASNENNRIKRIMHWTRQLGNSGSHHKSGEDLLGNANGAKALYYLQQIVLWFISYEINSKNHANNYEFTLFKARDYINFLNLLDDKTYITKDDITGYAIIATAIIDIENYDEETEAYKLYCHYYKNNNDICRMEQISEFVAKKEALEEYMPMHHMQSQNNIIGVLLAPIKQLSDIQCYDLTRAMFRAENEVYKNLKVSINKWDQFFAENNEEYSKRLLNLGAVRLGRISVVYEDPTKYSNHSEIRMKFMPRKRIIHFFNEVDYFDPETNSAVFFVKNCAQYKEFFMGSTKQASGTVWGTLTPQGINSFIAVFSDYGVKDGFYAFFTMTDFSSGHYEIKSREETIKYWQQETISAFETGKKYIDNIDFHIPEIVIENPLNHKIIAVKQNIELCREEKKRSVGDLEYYKQERIVAEKEVKYRNETVHKLSLNKEAVENDKRTFVEQCKNIVANVENEFNELKSDIDRNFKDIVKNPGMCEENIRIKISRNFWRSTSNIISSKDLDLFIDGQLEELHNELDVLLNQEGLKNIGSITKSKVDNLSKAFKWANNTVVEIGKKAFEVTKSIFNMDSSEKKNSFEESCHKLTERILQKRYDYIMEKVSEYRKSEEMKYDSKIKVCLELLAEPQENLKSAQEKLDNIKDNITREIESIDVFTQKIFEGEKCLENFQSYAGWNFKKQYNGYLKYINFVEDAEEKINLLLDLCLTSKDADNLKDI